jgi:hypothetical protein
MHPHLWGPGVAKITGNFFGTLAALFLSDLSVPSMTGGDRTGFSEPEGWLPGRVPTTPRCASLSTSQLVHTQSSDVDLIQGRDDKIGVRRGQELLVIGSGHT